MNNRIVKTVLKHDLNGRPYDNITHQVVEYSQETPNSPLYFKGVIFEGIWEDCEHYLALHTGKNRRLSVINKINQATKDLKQALELLVAENKQVQFDGSISMNLAEKNRVISDIAKKVNNIVTGGFSL